MFPSPTFIWKSLLEPGVNQDSQGLVIQRFVKAKAVRRPVNPKKTSSEGVIPTNNDVHSQKSLESQDLHRTASEALLQDPRFLVFYNHKSFDRLPKEQKGGDRHRFRRI